jgi:hypothetical protein
MAEPVRARRLTDEGGRRLQRIVRRGKHGSVRVRRATIIKTDSAARLAKPRRRPADAHNRSNRISCSPRLSTTFIARSAGTTKRRRRYSARTRSGAAAEPDDHMRHVFGGIRVYSESDFPSSRAGSSACCAGLRTDGSVGSGGVGLEPDRTEVVSSGYTHRLLRLGSSLRGIFPRRPGSPRRSRGGA